MSLTVVHGGVVVPGFGGVRAGSVRAGAGEASEQTAPDFIPSSCIRESEKSLHSLLREWPQLENILNHAKFKTSQYNHFISSSCGAGLLAGKESQREREGRTGKINPRDACQYLFLSWGCLNCSKIIWVI